MDKLDLILEKLIKIDNKIDKAEADISGLKNDNKVTDQKIDMIIKEVANIKEQIIDHDIKIQVINNKTKAICQR